MYFKISKLEIKMSKNFFKELKTKTKIKIIKIPTKLIVKIINAL